MYIPFEKAQPNKCESLVSGIRPYFSTLKRVVGQAGRAVTQGQRPVGTVTSLLGQFPHVGSVRVVNLPIFIQGLEGL